MSLAKVPNLKILVLSHNNIKDVPKELQLMNQLHGLVLDHNPNIDITSLLQHLEKLPNLKVILLRNNNLVQLPEDVKSLSGLEVLELSGNNFSIAEQQRIKAAMPGVNGIF